MTAASSSSNIEVVIYFSFGNLEINDLSKLFL